MKKIAAVILLLTSTAALAQEPTEERKAWALKRAYQINGYSMVGWGSIDLSNEQPHALVIKTVPMAPNSTEPIGSPVPLPPEKPHHHGHH